MERKSFLIALLSLLLISNCTNKDVISIDTKPIDIPIIHPNSPAPIVMGSVFWKVIEVNGIIYYAITINDYQVLAQNLLEVKRYITEQKAIIRFYENVTR